MHEAPHLSSVELSDGRDFNSLASVARLLLGLGTGRAGALARSTFLIGAAGALAGTCAGGLEVRVLALTLGAGARA